MRIDRSTIRTTSAFGLGSALGVLLLLVMLAPSVQAQYHEDDRFGYKIGIPNGWQQIPIQVDEEWIIAKYLCDKATRYTDDQGFSSDHKTDMQVIAFIDKVTDGPKVEAKETGENEFTISINNPFKDYPDYLRRTFNEGGWFENGREERKVGGVDVTCLDIKVEKLTRSGPMRITTWIFHHDGVDIAIQFQCLEDGYKKQRGLILGSLRSFKTIPRTGQLGPADQTGTRRITITKMDKLTPDQRRLQRMELEKQLIEKTVSRLPNDWEHAEVGNFLLLDHADDKFKFAKKILTQAQAVMSWLEKTFPEVGEGEYVRSPIIRVCKDYDEEKAFRKSSGSSGWSGMGTEIVVHRDLGFAGEYELQWVNRRVMDIWFQDRDRELYWALPPWLGTGLRQFIGSAEAKGKRLQFRPESWETTTLKIAAQKRELVAPRELMRLSSGDFLGESVSIRVHSATSLVRFLVAGPGARNRLTKDVLPDYLENLKAVITEMEEKDKAEKKTDSEDPTTEEEEEEQFKVEREKWQQRRQEILDQVFELTFGEWSDADWKRFEQAYYKSIL